MFASVPCVSGTAVLTLELAMKIVSIITPCFHMLLLFYFENPLLSQKFPSVSLPKGEVSPPSFSSAWKETLSNVFESWESGKNAFSQ